jgi:hypothetical protein
MKKLNYQKITKLPKTHRLIGRFKIGGTYDGK